MATAANDTPKGRKAGYSVEYRTEALTLAERIGVAAAASELGLHATQIYQWRVKETHEKSASDRERQLEKETARLKRQLADKTEEVTILEKTAAYFAKKLDRRSPLFTSIDRLTASRAVATMRDWAVGRPPLSAWPSGPSGMRRWSSCLRRTSAATARLAFARSWRLKAWS